MDDEYNSTRKRQRLLRAAKVREHVSSIQSGLASGGIHPIDGTIVFPTVDPAQVLQPHRDALILTLGVGDFDVKRILVDPGSSADLLQVAVIKQMSFEPSNLENPGRTLSGFNGSSTNLTWGCNTAGSSWTSHPKRYIFLWLRIYPISMPSWDACDCTE